MLRRGRNRDWCAARNSARNSAQFGAIRAQFSDAHGTPSSGSPNAKFADRAKGSGWGYFGSLSIAKGTRNEIYASVSFEYVT